jgi:prolyl 4-hydroxylase
MATATCSDDCDDIDDYNDSEEQEQDEEESIEENDSVWDDVKGAWRQHLLAILVAVAAASYLHLSTNGTASSSLQVMNAYLHEWMGIPHFHLRSYKRTANISFCPILAEEDNLQQHHDPSFSFKRFHFTIPRHLLHVMEAHFKADQFEDDYYEHVWDSSSATTTTNVEDAEYTCLQEASAAQVSMSKNPNVKGYAWAYHPPSFGRMFPLASLENTVAAGAASLSFTGFAAKFINLGPTAVLLHWDGRGGTEDSARLVGELGPYQALGTATTPGQSFYVSPVYDSKHALQRWTVTADTPLIVYTPDNNKEVTTITPRQELLRDMQLVNLEFARDYKVATKRNWLATFPRPHPMHYMRPADYVGQVQSVVVVLDDDKTRAMEAKVVSVTPRVMTIHNFLSKDECDYLIHQANEQGLEASTVVSGIGDGGSAANHLRHETTRSSFNAWIPREMSNTTNAIYRRAAVLLGMDESLFRHRSHNHLDIASHNSLTESLQVVRYMQDQEYTAHHDFVHPHTHNRHQPTRFATLLLYLNTPIKGGETVFPRAVNPTNHDGLVITPKEGTAVLFYNLLPDGNMDDLSQHASKPVLEGEKWLANLWVWDPIID